MTGLRALWYADWRAIVAETKRIVRSPGRLTIWIVYAVFLGLLVVRRLVPHHLVTPTGVLLYPADLGVCGGLFIVAAALIGGYGADGFFHSRCEARFIISSEVTAAFAIGYLQTRESLARGRRYLFSLVYLTFIVGPRGLGLGTVLCSLALGAATIVSAGAIAVPRRLATGPAVATYRFAGFLLAAFALAIAVRDLLTMFPGVLPAMLVARIVAVLAPLGPLLHPGRLLLEPSAFTLAGAVVVCASAIVLLAVAGADAYPELYALSVARIERRENAPVRRRPPLPGRLHVRIPAGIPALVWKSAVEFRRRSDPRKIVAGVLLCCIAGYAVARLAALQYGPIAVTALGINAINILMLLAAGTPALLADELRNPLFWLTGTPLFERLCALALGRSWPTLVAFIVGAAAFAVGGGQVLDVALIALGLPAVVLVATAIGFATYAFFPSRADRRGPAALLRYLVSLLVLAPPVLLAAGVAVVTRIPIAALCGAIVLAVVEALALIGIAAWRLDGRIDRAGAASDQS